MKDTFLQIAGVQSEKEFYEKYPTEEAFFSEHPEAMQMKHGGAVDLNAFYNQPRFVQTNIFREGGVLDEFLPEFQWAGPTDPSVVMLPDQQKIWRQNQEQWGTPPANQTIKVADNEAGQTNFTGAAPTGAAPSFTPAAPGAQTTMKVADNLAGVTNFTGAASTPNTPIDLSGAKGPRASRRDQLFTPQQQVPQGYAAWRDQQMKANPTINASVPNPINANPAKTTVDNKTTSGTPGTTSMWQPVANHQIFNGKTYRKLNDLATMPLYNPAVGMLSDNGLSGYIKMGIGAMAGISGMATGLDNIWRGFKGRKQEGAGTIKADIKDQGQTNFTGSTPPVNATPIDLSNANGPIQNQYLPYQVQEQKLPSVPTAPTGYNRPEMMQQSPMQEMQLKQQQQINPPITTSPINPQPAPPINYNKTARYGGDLYQAANGIDFTKNPAIDPSKVKVGETQYAVDLQGGLNRALGANMGMSMFNNTLGYKQGMKAVRENTIKAGMTDFGYQPDDTNWMPMGYDTLNTGPGQTQAPNLHTPIQYAGMQMTSQYEEGGEYDLTEEEIQQILAAGGEVEFM